MASFSVHAVVKSLTCRFKTRLSPDSSSFLLIIRSERIYGWNDEEDELPPRPTSAAGVSVAARGGAHGC